MDPSASGACVVGRVRIRDAAGWARYRDAVPATLVPFDGTVVVRGHDARVLTGDASETDVVVIRFPSLAAATNWYDSVAYRALIALRDESADVVIVAYEV